MKVPFSWIKEFVSLEADPFLVAEKLTMRGFEVETVEERRISFSDVFVAEIIKMEKPEGLDNLLLVELDIGKETLSVLCGAKNIKLGDKVPLAKIGARIADGRRIEKRRIKGIDSYGMLCSERELGLSEDHSGIFILPPNLKKGQRLEEIEGIKEYVLDINVTPNRGDCLSVLGIAREIGSIFNERVNLPEIELFEDEEEIEHHVDLEVVDLNACPRYVLRMIKDVSIGPSPFFIRDRLSLCGMRPINSIVDVTNYVMLELGQPLHAFDYELIRKRSIVVKLSDSSLIFETLDGVNRILMEGDLLICDGEGPVAIAGIMGGKNSEITENTRHVLLESACFNPFYIRRTQSRLNIKSEASVRFSRGVDIEIADYAAKRALSLMKEVAGGRIIKGKKETRREGQKKVISVSLPELEKAIGIKVEEEEALRLLKSIEFDVRKEEEGNLLISVPSFRYDIHEFMDIVEEVARLIGYDVIPSTIPEGILKVGERESRYGILRRIKEFFVASGFFEVVNLAFCSQKEIENFFIEEGDRRRRFVKIINPLSKEQEFVRTFLLPGLLNNLAYNFRRGIKNLRIFEVAKVFFMEEGKPVEPFHLAFIMTGKDFEYFWRETLKEYDFYDAKGIIEAFFDRFQLDVSIEKGFEPFLHEDLSADILMEGKKIGFLGKIEKEVLKRYDIENEVYACEIEVEEILEKAHLYGRFQSLSKFPPVIRDFSFYVEEKIPVSTLVERIKRISPLIVDVGIFDVYKREKRSVSFRVFFQSFTETLKEELIDSLQERIIREVTQIEGVTLRT